MHLMIQNFFSLTLQKKKSGGFSQQPVPCHFQLTIAVPFWLVNKSGLPLVFRQDGSGSEAAGQFDEHERARSITPLLFSFSDHDEPNL